MSGLSINLKYPCNSIGSVTNKGTKPPEIKLATNKIAVKYNDLGIIVLRPVIDRLHFSFVPDEKLLQLYDPSVKLDEYQSFIKGHLAGDGFHTEITGLKYIEEVSFLKPPFSLYELNLVYELCPLSEPVIIQVSPKKGGRGFVRFDMNPNRITEKGMKLFWELIDGILVLPSGPISREHFRIWSKIHSMEIAVDILGARPSELDFRPMANNKPALHKSHVYKSQSGRVQTKYTKAKSGSEYLYDKRIELLETGKQPIYSDFLHSRFEARVKDTGFYKLGNIKNRCGRANIHALSYRKLATLKHAQYFFLRYALERNLEKALAKVPKKHHKTYKAAYDGSLFHIWDSKKIWSYWPETLKRSGLFLD